MDVPNFWRYFAQFCRYNVRIIQYLQTSQDISLRFMIGQLVSYPTWAGSGAHEATARRRQYTLQFCAFPPQGTDNGCVQNLDRETRRHNSENAGYMGT
jgi:hypothetical protein